LFATALADDAFLNTGNAQVNVIYTVVPVSAAGCQGASFTVTVPVDPQPAVAVQTTAATCSGTPVGVNFNSSTGVAASAYNVTGLNLNGLSVSAGGAGVASGLVAADLADDAFLNTTNAQVSVIYTVVPVSALGCQGASFTVTVPVNPRPIIPDQVSTICSGATFTVTPINSGPTVVPAGTQYTWTAPTVAPTLGSLTGAGAQAVGVASISQTLTNTTNVAQTATYIVTPTSGAGCAGATFQVTVTVNPKPVIFNRVATICSGGTFTISPADGLPLPTTIVPAGSTYTWGAPVVTAGITGGSAQSGQASISQTLSTTSTAPGTATYTVTPTSGAAGACVGATFQVVVTVNPIPKLSSTLTPAAICSGLFTYTPISATATATFTWTRAAVSGISQSASAGSGPVSETLTNSTTLPVVVTYRFITSANGCTNTPGEDVQVTVNPTPLPNAIIGPANVCVSSNTFFYQVTQVPGSTYSWDVPAEFTVQAAGGGATPGGGQGLYTGDYFILLKFSTATTKTLSVYEKSADGCVGLVNVLPIVVSSGPTEVDITSGAFTSTSGGTFCKNQTGVVFQVPQNASSNFIWTIDSGGSIVGPMAGTNLYQIVVNFNNSPTANINVTEINLAGCPATYPTFVASMLDAPIMTPASGSICSGLQPSSVITLSTTPAVPSTFSWIVKSKTANILGAFVNDTGTGPLTHFPAVLTNNSGFDGTIVYTVTPTATASPNCIGSPIDITVTVKPEPVIASIGNQSVCPLTFVNGTVSFPFSNNLVPVNNSFDWTSSNPAIGLVAASGSGNISFTSADNQTGFDIVSNITVTTTANGCTSTGANAKSFTITLKPRPVVGAITDILVCPGDAISVPAFTANTSGGETYAWTNDNTAIGLVASGSGNISSYFAPSNNTGSNLVGNISVVGSLNSCTGPAQTFKITVRPEPVVASIANQTYCAGETISIPLSSNVGAATINWSNSNTSIGLPAGPVSGSTITGTAPVNNTGSDIVGIITVSATANGCTSSGSNSKTFTITIKPTPVVDPLGNIVVCSGGTVPATIFGSNVALGGVTFNWTNNNTAINLSAGGSGNIASFTAGVNVTGSPIVATISVTGSKNLCTGPAQTFTITVNPEPVVNGVVNQSFCPTDAVSIPLGSNVGGASINWTNTNPLIGLGVSGTGNINFTAPANNTGSNIVGTISVSATNLSCTSAGGNTKTFTITIKPTPIVASVSDVTVCSGATVPAIGFSANTGGSETFTWTNDNAAVGLSLGSTGNIASYTAPVNTTGTPFVGNFTVTATKNGCSGPAQTFRININPEPVVDLVANQSFCAGEPINIPFSSNVAGSSFTWTNTNTLIGLASTGGGNIVYIAPANNTGSDIVGVIDVIATRNGCVSAGANAKSFTITIKPTPIVNAISNVTVCSGGTVAAIAFGSNAGSGVTFNWTNDNTGTNLAASGSGATIPSFTAAINTTSSPFVSTISVTGTKNGCLGPVRTFTISVNPQPVGNTTAVSICSDEAVGINLATLLTGSAASYSLSINNNGLTATAGLPINGSAFPATEIQDDRWRNLSGIPVDVVYSITPLGAGTPACSGAPFTLTVTVKPEPVVAAVLNQSYCPATTQSILLTSNVSGATISWTNTNPLIGLGFTGSGDINFTTPANNTGADITGTITVSSSKDGCTSSGLNIKTFDITIKPSPIVSVVTDITVCSGDLIPAVVFSANTSGGESFNWTNDNVAIGQAASGSGNILSYSAPINTSGIPIVANFSVIATKNLCSGPARTFRITINPQPVVAAVTDKVYCAGESVSIPLTSNVSGAALSWTNSNAAIGIGLSGSGDIVYTAPTNNTGVDIVGTIVVSASKNGCVSVGANTKTFTVTIKPTPIVNAISDIVICSGQAINILPFGSNVVSAGVTFNWTNDNTAINLGSSGTGNIASFTGATNISGLPISATISVTGTKNLCSGPAKTFTITINPEPEVATVTNKTFCPGDLVNIPLTSNVAASAITWTNSNPLIGTALSGSGDLVFTAPANNTGADFVGTIVVTASKNSCVSTGANAKTFTITIKTTPVVAVVSSIVRCSGDPVPGVVFTSNADPGVTFDWTNDNPGINLAASGSGNIAGFTSSINVGSTPLIANINVRGTKNGCQGAATTFTTTINPQPVLSVPAPPAICSSNLPNNPSTTGIVLGTNGTSVNANTYRINSILYNGGTAPAGFTFPVTNKSVGSSGGINHVQGDVFTNTSLVPVTVRYNITPISLLGCEGVATNVDLVVNPEPKLDPTLSPTPICSGDKIDPTGVAFQLRSQPAVSVASASFIIRSISFPATITAGGSNTGIGAGKNMDALDNDTYSNVTPGALTVTYTIAPVSAAGCIGPDQTVTITVNPAPALSTSLNKIVCSGEASTITMATTGSTIAATSYNYLSVTATGLTPGGSNVDLSTPKLNQPAGFISADRFTNTTNAPLTATYVVSPVSAVGCVGPPVSVVLTVEPAITMVIPTQVPLCSYSANSLSQTSFVLNSVVTPSAGNITYDYTAFSTPASAVSGFFASQGNLPGGTTISDKLVNNTNAVATVTYVITPKAVGAKGGLGCSAATPTTLVVSVEPQPRLSITPATQVICEGTPTTMKLSSNTSPGPGRRIRFVKVSATPTGGMTLPLTYTPKTTYDINDEIGDPWDNPQITTETVTYVFRSQIEEISSGAVICGSDDITVLLTVNPNPTIVASAQAPICSSDFVNITLTPDVANTVATYTVVAPATVSGASNGAGNLIFQTLFYNSLTPTEANSDASVTVNYTVTPRANNCTGAAIVVPVTVNPKPKLLKIPSTLRICHGDNLSIPLTSNVTGANYTWTVDNPSGLSGIVEQTTPGSGSINQIVTNTTGVQASLTYTIKAFGPGATSCEGDQKIVIVTVAPQMAASFQNPPSSICKGTSEFLIVQLNGQAPFSFIYNQNDAVTNSDVTVNGAGNFKVIQVNPTLTTTYTIKSIRDGFNCPLTITGQAVTISVGDPDANFSVVAPSASCGPVQFQFQYNQKAGTQYTWQWQDGSADSTYLAVADVSNKIVRHTFSNLSPNRDQDYNVVLRVELPAPFPGCFKFTSKKVTVYSAIVANIFADKTTICSGDKIQFTNQSLGVTSHKWFWRNVGSSLENEIKTTSSANYSFVNTTTTNPLPLEVVYQAKSGNCSAPDVVTLINVYRGVTANFSEGIVPPFNSGSSTVTYTNTSTPFEVAQFRYDWTFGITGDANPVTLAQTATGGIPVVYSSPGTKTIILSVTNKAAETAGLSCKSDINKNITIILPPLTASFDIDPTELCFPGSIKLKNVVGTGFIHEWRVVNKATGASFTSNVANPGEFKVSAPGTYSVSYRTSLTSTGQSASAPLKDVVIYDLPLATFDLRPDIVYVPDTEMSAFNFSGGANGYEWTFGDGGTSTDFEPKYTYKVEGKYDVTLIAKFDHGNGVVCRDTLTRVIIAKQGGLAKIPNSFTPNPNGRSSTGTGGNGTFNDVFLPLIKGISNDSDAYNLQIYDRWGNLVFESTSSVVGWDGYNKDGKLMPMGVYVYKLTVRFSDSQRTTTVGDITMLY
ncbi:MAG: gliding motility-associated C-terminal domain-containing protein, partial [Cytophagales bacterium]|nr:gliding motility-associated C-terminal domain-containing protein [Microcystis sp. M151S2]MCA4900349.1 gliding motility-associated C-terminal domain-containing protein [Cytophagales bacterium]MCA6369340.1 gliding motility-associated C-terminal domain-containing protein [Cytophagales bacterium]